MDNLVQKILDAGVVGAGGAGFPTYQKIDGRAEIVIANGAECEPLLCKDQTLMENHPAEIIAGMLLVMQHMQASKGIVAIKAKNQKAIQTISAHLPENISIFEMENVYPAGDEYEVVYHSTGRRIPAGGIPLQIGVVVQNIETLFNIQNAVNGTPVTHSILTVHGHVKTPLTTWVPVGMSYGDVLEVAGGATIDDFVLIAGGAMMGNAVTDLSTPITRLTSGFIVMTQDAKLSRRKSQSEQTFKRIGKSACDQCSMCTEMCPRYLLGYPIQPHLVMRSLLTTGEMSETLTSWAQACCECNICTFWACPEELDPRNVCVVTKRDLKKNDKWLAPEQLKNLTRDVHPLKEYRSVPTKRLIQRLGLGKFKSEAVFQPEKVDAKSVAIPLQQHIGKPAIPVVQVEDKVQTGDLLAKADSNGLSVPIHASISGMIKSVGETIIIEKFRT